jgi:hypothetical protein
MRRRRMRVREAPTPGMQAASRAKKPIVAGLAGVVGGKDRPAEHFWLGSGRFVGVPACAYSWA